MTGVQSKMKTQKAFSGVFFLSRKAVFENGSDRAISG